MVTLVAGEDAENARKSELHCLIPNSWPSNDFGALGTGACGDFRKQSGSFSVQAAARVTYSSRW